jgi:hypothetical protein
MDDIFLDENHVYEARALRDKAYKEFAAQLSGGAGCAHIGQLVGNPNKCGSFLMDDWPGDIPLIKGVSRKQLDLLRALNGPHGYAIYRMLLLKKNSLQE